MQSTGSQDAGSKQGFTCDMVVARYKEPMRWLAKYSIFPFRTVYVYNKGLNARDCPIFGSTCVQIDLPNEGRCDHTYLYHIIHNYDKLADVTVFTKGSSDLPRERRKLPFTVKKVFETHDTVMSVTDSYLPIHIAMHQFHMNNYGVSHPDNRDRVAPMKRAAIRPFGKWYLSHFPKTIVNSWVQSGIFAVSREHIHNRPKSFYERLIKELEGHSNPEVGHYLERSWVAVFDPIPKRCLYVADREEGRTQMEGGAGVAAARRRTRRRRRT